MIKKISLLIVVTVILFSCEEKSFDAAVPTQENNTEEVPTTDSNPDEIIDTNDGSTIK